MMRRLLLGVFLFPSTAFATLLPSGVTATTVYELPAPATVPGNVSLPWGGQGFSMNGQSFIVYAMPPCVAPARWAALPVPVPPGAYGVLLVVDPFPGGVIHVPASGLRLSDPAATQYFACK